MGALRVGLELLLGRELRGGHHDRVEPVQRRVGGVERGGERRRVGEVQVVRAHPRVAARAQLEVPSALLQLGRVAADEEDAVAPLREPPRHRAPHPARSPEDDGLHDRSPKRRTDWALRMRCSGSHSSRIRFHSERRGSIAA